jgi:Tfp pilus assembly protein PilO
VTKRDRIVLVAIATLAVLGGFYMTVLKPIRADLAELDEQRSQAEQRRDTALADLNAATTARAAYRRDTATLALLGKAVPADDGVPSLLYQVEGAAKKAGVVFDTVKVGEGASAPAAAPAPAPAADGAAAAAPVAPEDPTPGTSEGPEGLQALPLKITFEGRFFRLEKFLSQVHKFARVNGERVDIEGRLLTIEGVQIVPGADGLPSLKAEITAKAYVAPAEAAKAGAGAAGSATTASTTSSGSASATPTATGSGEAR